MQEKPSIPYVLYLGVVLYVVSFFFVAIDDARGFQCALVTLTTFRNMFRTVTFYPGLINPLILGFIILKLLNEAARLRLAMGIVSILLFIPTWMVIQDMPIKIGCPLWVVSILLIIADDIGSWKPGSFRTAA